MKITPIKTYNTYNIYSNKNSSSFKANQNNDLKLLEPELVNKMPNDLLKEYSKALIFYLTADVNCKTDKELYNQADILYEKLSKGDVESSNTEMLMDLVQRDVLPSRIVCDVAENNKLNKNAEEDLDKLYESYIEGKDTKDIFLPKYSSENEALKSTKTGDLVRLEDKENIYIKMPDSSLKEIFLKPDTYLALFPPIERYSYTQGYNNDCFILAAMDSIHTNANLRYKMLELYKDNGNGTVSMSVNGFSRNKEGEIVNNGKREFQYDLNKFNNKKEFYSVTCKGVMIAEQLFQDDAQEIAKKNIEEAKSQYEAFLSNGIYYGDCKKREELENALYFINRSLENPQDKSKSVIDLSSLYTVFGFSENEPIDEKSYQKIKDKKVREYIKQINDRHMLQSKIYKKEYSMYDEIVPIEALNYFLADVVQNSQEIKNPYTYGGNASFIYNKLGFKAYLQKLDNEVAQALLFAQDSSEHCAFSVAANNTYENNGISVTANHSYSLFPVDIKGERKFLIRNPHNSSQETILDFKQLQDIFDYIEIGYTA